MTDTQTTESVWISDIGWDLQSVEDLEALGFAWSKKHGNNPREFIPADLHAAVVAERDALIANAMKHYKKPNPKKEPFDLAMHAITEERNGRKCADSLWKEADERIEELVAERDQLKAKLTELEKHRA